MDQTRAGLPALQLAGPQESASRVAPGLRRVKPEENRSPDHRLTATGKTRKTALRRRRKANPPFLVALHVENAPRSLSESVLWDRLLGGWLSEPETPAEI